MSNSTDESVRIGVDIGGTFTDIFAFRPADSTAWIEKVPSTPANPAEGVISGLAQLFETTEITPEEISLLSHGSTVTINALIERDGAKTGLLVTEGFRGIPLARHGEKPETEVKNPRYQQPDPLVPQYRVGEVPERVNDEGEVIKELDEQATREAIRELRERGIDSIAVCLLFSFRNPSHEQRVAELIEEIHPECSVSLSSEISPRIREYLRLSTTTVSAYVDPILDEYLSDFESKLGTLGCDPTALTMMLSHGGLSSFDAAAKYPASTVLSGPAAGVQGGLFTAEQTATDNVVTMDMGGTSCDIALAPNREPLTTTEKEIGQNPISVPLIDIQAIGAGGGTIASVEGGRLRVGPESAGADPGPVCYGHGGEKVTITDANLVLGRMSPDASLGGDLAVDSEAARDAILTQIAEPLGMDVTQAAAGIIRVVNDKMKKELSLALTKQGHDPRDFSLVVYGGAGPMHAAAIARSLSLKEIIVPPRPGINSAVGLLATDRRRLYERSRVDELTEAPLETIFEELREEATGELADSDVNLDQVTYERELELRYTGQSYELDVAVDETDTPHDLREKFDRQHEAKYGHVSDQIVETMTYRLAVTISTPQLPANALVGSENTVQAANTTSRTRDVYFDGEYHETDIYHRSTLQPESVFSGPAIVEQSDTTIVVEPAVDVKVDEAGNLVMTNLEGDK